MTNSSFKKRQQYYDYMRSVFRDFDGTYIDTIFHLAYNDDPDFLAEIVWFCDQLLDDNLSFDEVKDLWREATTYGNDFYDESLYRNIFLLKYEADNHRHRLLKGREKYSGKNLIDAYNAFVTKRGYPPHEGEP